MEINVKRLRSAMMDAQLNVRSLSKKSGVCPAAINSIINHGKRARIDTIGKLAAALGISGMELVED